MLHSGTKPACMLHWAQCQRCLSCNNWTVSHMQWGVDTWLSDHRECCTKLNYSQLHWINSCTIITKKAEKAGGQWSCTLPYNLYGNHAVMWAVMIKIRIQLQFAETWMYRDHTVHTNQGHWLTTHTTQAVISCCVLYTLYNTVCVHRGMEEQSDCVCGVCACMWTCACVLCAWCVCV